jgi:hypothetical protein
LFEQLGQLGLGFLASSAQTALHLGRILEAAAPLADLLVVRQYLVQVRLDVADGRLDIIGRQAKQAGNLVVLPAFAAIVHNIVDGDPRSFDFRTSPPVNDSGRHDTAPL